MNTAIACIQLGSVHVVVVNSPVIAREFLKTQDAVFASRPTSMSTHIVSRGYLTTALVPFGEQWKKMKKILVKELLSPQKHQWLHDERIGEADNLVRYVFNQCNDPNKGGLVNVRIAAQHYCGNVIRKMIFNKRYFGKNMKDGSPGFEEVEHVDATFKEVMIEVVDNPSNAAEWAIAEMLNNPELLQRATEELDRVVGKERLVQELDLPKLNYVKACAREAFRLHPIVPFNLPHVFMADSVVNNYFIPKGSHVLLSRTELGRNPKVCNEPLNFKPDRHLKSDGSEVVLTESNLGFISFSTGKRACPRVVLGTSITVMLFARSLHGFSWSVAPNQSSIDLSEAADDLFLAKPLVAVAKPRLPLHLYPR
ncbi:hypothetical protein L6164_002153 [Bauhinia variegata]|uniref:Uncharacterized protein n=1 Tax=Bauhinia variegata TaxID=167791 RepID=A0ACB9PWS0_BAUVA|nr:hypothetical protein L6164_002153 [Bauhinia variegata]